MKRRNDSIHGWTAHDKRNVQQDCNAVEGRVVEDVTTGSWTRELVLDEKHIHLDGQEQDALRPWFSLKGARQLVCVGARVKIETADETQDDNVMAATKLHLTAALPAAPYLSKLLVLPQSTLDTLFASEGLEQALASTAHEVAVLRNLALAEKEAGRFALLFKHSSITNLATRLREAQGFQKGPQKIPRTMISTWKALEQMEQRYAVTTRETRPTADSIEIPSTVDPSLNLPNVQDRRRQLYVDERKRPQVLWMMRRIVALVGHSSGTIVDVGGGRGDLAICLAAHYDAVATPQVVKVVVLDINLSSLQAGKERARQANLLKNIDFVECDLGDVAPFADYRNISLVYGLHCCGGLAEAAMNLALREKANFFISTCCFRSNLHLNILTTKEADDGDDDVDKVSALAVVAGAEGQERAIRVLNARRLRAVKTYMSTWQEFFPVEYSVQNAVMVGVRNCSEQQPG